jgi:hypothetical protein
VPGRQSIKQWLEQFREPGSILRQKDAGRPSVDPETAGMVHEPCQPVSQMANLQSNGSFLFFQRNGASPHWALY